MAGILTAFVCGVGVGAYALAEHHTAPIVGLGLLVSYGLGFVRGAS